MFRKKFLKPEKGQDLVEYALLLVLAAIVIIAFLSTFSSPRFPEIYDGISNFFRQLLGNSFGKG